MILFSFCLFLHHSPGAFAQVLKIPKFYFEVMHAIIVYLQMMLNKSTFYEKRAYLDCFIQSFVYIQHSKFFRTTFQVGKPVTQFYVCIAVAFYRHKVFSSVT